MPASLRSQKDFQRVRKLPFCYWCGGAFIEGDSCDADHVPPSAVFNIEDRSPVLKLKTHTRCHKPFADEDKQIGQLIGMRLRKASPPSFRDRALNYIPLPQGIVGITNVPLNRSLWRWVKGFHSALYQEPVIGRFAVTTPYPMGRRSDGQVIIQPVLKQHLLAVELIKRNRAFDNIDSIVAYRGKLRYECVWFQRDGAEEWMCAFALDLYDWKHLAGYSASIKSRGCAGIYMYADGRVQRGGCMDRKSDIVVQSLDTLDPFAP